MIGRRTPPAGRCAPLPVVLVLGGICSKLTCRADHHRAGLGQVTSPRQVQPGLVTMYAVGSGQLLIRPVRNQHTSGSQLQLLAPQRTVQLGAGDSVAARSMSTPSSAGMSA